DIKKHIDNPVQLEKLYRADKKGFEHAFFEIYPEIADKNAADFWKTRLEFDNPGEDKEKKWKTNVLYLIITCLVTGLMIKIPQLTNLDINTYLFYEKNAGLIVFLGLSAFVILTKKQINTKFLIISAIVFIISAMYINLLPSDRDSHSINLAYIHLPLFLWCLYGFIFIGFDANDRIKRIDYIKYNGDLAILGAIILIAGGILTVVTLGLFSAIDLDIEKFYFDYIVIIGLVSVPIVATFVINSFPSITTKIAPVIATIFSPLVLVTLIIYLVSIVLTGKDPYSDRDFLIVFNLLLIGVMAIIVFSVSETSEGEKQKFSELTLLVLSIITLIVDLIALSAIVYRLGEYGFSPNRTAVLGSNLLIFGNLVWIMIELYRVCCKGDDIKKVELIIARYLPVYALWTIFVTFGFPLIFGMK
ncbi:DUF4153 domain-containing protein, partial [Anaerophaga thermohalophila]|uniref:DUF4153 domain-containing protein n=1 Tax=Anaerophaga thermohalophila TaxID=177400 RepID=UPI00037CC997